MSRETVLSMAANLQRSTVELKVNIVVLGPVDALEDERSNLQTSQHPNPDDRIVLMPYDKAYEAGFEDVQRRVDDVSKMRGFVGWEPAATLDDILIDVTRWMGEQNPRRGDETGNGSNG